MKIYLSGPMSGLPQFNIPEFDAAAAVLRADDHEVCNPPEEDPAEVRAECLASEDGTLSRPSLWGECLGRDITHISSAGFDAICLLKGWGQSWGSTMELITAIRANCEVYMLCPAEDYDHVSEVVDGDGSMIITLESGDFLLRMPEPFKVNMVANAVAELTATHLSTLRVEPEVLH